MVNALNRLRLGALTLSIAGVAAFVPSASAQMSDAGGARGPSDPIYVVDIGVDPDLVQEGLIDALTPYLIVAIALGFGFFAVKLGVRWLKSNARG